MMTTILRIDASARPGPADAAGEQASFSRMLADAMQQGLIGRHGARIGTLRDLATDPLPAIADTTIKGFYAPPRRWTTGYGRQRPYRIG
jgi:FMN-dependent NADH-azoreductase